MYSKPSFQDNLFDGIDVDINEFEVSVKCPKKNSEIIKHNYSTRTRTKTTKNYYIIKRPLNGYLNLKVFCHFCEKYYKLKIESEKHNNNRRKILISIYTILGLSFWYSKLPVGVIGYIVWIYLLAKVYRAFKISFVEASKKHRARIVRLWEPTQLIH